MEHPRFKKNRKSAKIHIPQRALIFTLELNRLVNHSTQKYLIHESNDESNGSTHGTHWIGQVESVFFRQVFTCIRTNNDNRMKINKEYSTSIYGTGKHITQDRSDRTIRR